MSDNRVILEWKDPERSVKSGIKLNDPLTRSMPSHVRVYHLGLFGIDSTTLVSKPPPYTHEIPRISYQKGTITLNEVVIHCRSHTKCHRYSRRKRLRLCTHSASRPHPYSQPTTLDHV